MEEFDLDLIQVLWVEDDPEVTERYPEKAVEFGLQLNAYSCWDDAKAALEGDYDRWSAIILDAKCKFHRESNDNAVVFLREALDDISTICERKGRIIPWYILTGGDTSEVSDSINDKRLKWDGGWTEKKHKKYYSKNTDNEDLYIRIREHAQISCRIQTQQMYQDVCDDLTLLSKESRDDILTILETMHFPKSHSDFIPHLYYNPLRKALEGVYRLAGKAGIIHDDFFKGGQVNINQCFMFLIGSPAVKIGYKATERIAPRHIEEMMSLIMNIGNINSHSLAESQPTELSEAEIQGYDNHIKQSGTNSKYLVFSMALQLCEILRWMKNYIAKNPNREENIKKCVPIEKIESVEKEGVNEPELIGILEEHQGICHMGSKFSVLLKHKDWLGKKVKICNYIINTNPKTQKYPYFVREEDFELIG